jgi:hypothetical protein
MSSVNSNWGRIPGRALKRIASACGFEVRRKSAAPATVVRAPDEFDQAFDVVKENTMVATDALRSLYDQVRFCERRAVPGAYVECGVWKGGSIGVMALANLKHSGTRRELHLFDAFDDICQPDASVDGDRAVREVRQWTSDGGTAGKLVPLKGIYDQFGGHGTIEVCRDLLERKIGYPSSSTIYHEGWFQETLPRDAESIDKIAILRLDGDWYASTKVCLDYLFDKVVPGGFVIIDDYGAYDGCRKAVDEFIERLGRPYFLNVVNSETRYLIKA